MNIKIQTFIVSFILVFAFLEAYPFIMTNNTLNIDFSPSTTNLIYDRVNVSIMPPPNPSLALGMNISSFKITNVIIDKSKMEQFQTLFINVNLSPSTTVECYILDGRKNTTIAILQLTSSKKNYFFNLLDLIPKRTDNIYMLFNSVSYSPVGGHFYLISITKDVSIETDITENEVRVYPNPLIRNDDTLKIAISLPSASRISLVIFDSTGNIVKTIVRDSLLGEGVHVFEWDTKDDRGREVSSGKYIAFLKTEKTQRSKAFLVVR